MPLFAPEPAFINKQEKKLALTEITLDRFDDERNI